jgi:hypothetical protein
MSRVFRLASRKVKKKKKKREFFGNESGEAGATRMRAGKLVVRKTNLAAFFGREDYGVRLARRV